MKKSEPMTMERAALARALFHEADISQHDIATLLCCNQGRVSEAVDEGGRHMDLKTDRARYLLAVMVANAVLRLTSQVGPYIDDNPDLFARR
jgi:predicted transcriptional regulator